VDNIPLTVAMIPVISGIAETGLPGVNLLWWALVFGVGFGGNGSAIGSTANIIVVSKAEKENIPITFKSWFKYGTPTMITTLIFVTVIIYFFGDILQK
jgi:Na+/H+ antiporter NhaD/arsenite permease-like protein